MSSATELLGDDELNSLIRTCVRNNLRENITGLLMYNGGNFIQALEGQKDDVIKLFERIRVDQRHTGIIALTEGPVDSRCFKGWSMGLHRSETGEDPACDAVFTISEQAIRRRMAPAASDEVLIFMRSFYDLNRHSSER